MRHRKFAGGLFLIIAGALPLSNTLVAAQQSASPGTPQNQSQGQTSGPQYDPTADAIVTGLKGIATGAQAALGNFSDATRATQIQNALIAAIDDAKDKSQIKLDLKNVSVLCDVRESYAQAKAHTDHINAVTGALDAVATPATINSLGDAIGSFFKKYSINVKDDGAPAPPGATKNACIADLEAWADSYYDRERLKARLAAATTAAPGGIDALFGDLSAVSGIVGAIISIITPIATYAANEENQAKRQALIDGYLFDPGPPKANKNIETLLAEARALATASNNLAIQARYAALGQFVEKMTALRETSIDLTKLKFGDQTCDKAMNNYAGESEKIPLPTTAETAPGSAILHFDAVPAWIKPGMNIYLTDGSKAPDAAVEALQGPGSVTMTVEAPKGGIPKGTAITFSSPDQKTNGIVVPGEKTSLETSAPTPAGDKTLHFDTLAAWIAPGIKVTAAKPSINASVASVTFTSVEMTKAVTGSSVPEKAAVQFTFSTASEGYVSCFAQASKQISQAASDVVKAAANYDTAAQAQTSSDGLTAKLNAIEAATKTKEPWPTSKDSPAAEDAAELAAFGNAMLKAFSQSNINALQNALDAAKKQF